MNHMDIYFDDCKNDYNVVVTLNLNGGSGHLLIQWLDEPTDSVDVIARRLDSNVLVGWSLGDGFYRFEVNRLYDPIKVARRVAEWLTAQGCKVSLNLSGAS